MRPMKFSFYGPTCDDLDRMAGPFELPADVGPGDYIEIGMLGAYGCAMRTQFNGFGVAMPRSSTTSRWPASTAPGARALERREAVDRSSDGFGVRRHPREIGDPASFSDQRE